MSDHWYYSSFSSCSSVQSNPAIQRYFGIVCHVLSEPYRFHSSAFLTMLSVFLLNTWPNHFHFRYLISFQISYCFDIFHSSWFDMVLGHHTPKINIKLLFMKICNLFSISYDAFQVSETHNNMSLPLVLKILLFELRGVSISI